MRISVENLSYAYGGRQVLGGVTFAAGEGQLLSLLGPNGAGKSTLFRCMLGLLRPAAGRVLLSGEDIKTLTHRQMARRVAYIPQSHYPAFQYSVLEMVLMGTSAGVSYAASPGRAEREAAHAAIERLGIEGLAHRDYTRLSGGERQLTLIARALAQQSKVLLMDEPTANLDFGNQMRVLTQVRALADEGYTVLVSTHNPEQAYAFSHGLLALMEGRIIASGSPKEVLDDGLVRRLYGIPAKVHSLMGDAIRVCVPMITKEERT